MVRAMESGLAPTPEQIATFVEQHTLEAGGTPRNLKLAGSVAQIDVHGILTPKPDFFARYFFGGNTTYEEILAAISLAEADPAVKQVVFSIDSPGGHSAGLFDVFAAIESMRKPKLAVAAYACSAAYGIAAATGRIEATNRAVEVGSVGVAITYMDDPAIIDITSTEAPDKRPDPATEEGRAVIRRELDAIHELFAETIAKGRKTTVEKVNEKFGRGAVMIASDAKRRGMLDAIRTPRLRSVTVSGSEANVAGLARGFRVYSGAGVQSPLQLIASDQQDSAVQPHSEGTNQSTPEALEGIDETPTTSAPTQKGGSMDLHTLKKDFPDVYKAAVREGREAAAEDNAQAVASAGESAIKTERDRVESFLVAGESSGDMKTAIECIRSGDEMTQTNMVKFMFAGRNKQDTDARQLETDQAAAATAATSTEPESQDLGDKVVALLEKQRGGKK